MYGCCTHMHVQLAVSGDVQSSSGGIDLPRGKSSSAQSHACWQSQQYVTWLTLRSGASFVCGTAAVTRC